MEVELKDVLHLYLGCQVKTNYRRESESGKSMTREVGQLVDCDLMMGDNYGVKFSWQSNYEHTTIPLKDIKPILRPLSDMKEDEKAFVYKFEDGYFRLPTLESLKVDALITTYLLKKGFDLFGLINSNIALDKTKIELDERK